MTASPVSSFADRVRRMPPRHRIYYGVLLAITVALGLFLANAPLPWEEGVAAREAAERNVKTIHHSITGLYYGAWAALMVVGLLALCGPMALRLLSPDFVRTKAGLGRRSCLVFLIFAAGAMLLAGVRMAPRLDSSLWGDEDYTVRRAVVGQYERNDEGELWFRKVTWNDTLFAYRNPNNHVLFSVLARLSLGDYEPGKDPQKLHFDETRLRMPSFIAGLLAIASVGYLLATIGFTRAGIAAMFVLALHPWFLRHGCEARGYPLALALGPLCLTFLIKALQRGRPGYWAAFALSEFLVFYAYPGTIYLLAGINIAALAYIALRDNSTRDRISLGSRWFVANTFAALPLIFLMAPNLPQLKAYIEKNSDVAGPDAAWIWDNLCYLATGRPWFAWESGNPYDFHLSANAIGSGFALACIFGIAICGIVRLCRNWRENLWLVIALALPYGLMLTHSVIAGGRVYQWYAIPMLPTFIIALAMGIESLPARIRDVRLRTLAGFGTLALFLAFYAAFSSGITGALRERSVGPLRESVAATRPVLNPNLPEIGEVLTAQFCMGTPGYDPTAYFFKTDDPEAFRALMARADRESKPLFVNIALPKLAEQGWPGVMRLVNDPTLFETSGPLWGLQAPSTRFLFRYRGKAAVSDGP